MFKLQHKVTPFLWLDSQASVAAAQYVKLFGAGRIVHEQRWGEGAHQPPGSVMAVTLELGGQTLMLFNGGPHFKLNPAASLFVQCDDQAEVDRLWEGLIEGGGAPSQCGWLVDRFGLSWQIVPSAFLHMVADSDGARVARVMAAMMEMVKLDISGLQRAFDGA